MELPRTPLPRRPAPGERLDAAALPDPRPDEGARDLSSTLALTLVSALRAAPDVALALLEVEAGRAGGWRLLELTPAFAGWAGGLAAGDLLPAGLAALLPLADLSKGRGAGAVVGTPSLPGHPGPVHAHLTPTGPGGVLVVLTPAAAAEGRRPAVPGRVLQALPGPQDLVRRFADRSRAARTAAGTVVLHVRLRRSAGGTPVPVTMLEPVVQRLQQSLRAEDLLVRWAPRTLGLLLVVPPGREEQVAASVRQRLLAGPEGELLEVRTADRDALLGRAPAAG